MSDLRASNFRGRTSGSVPELPDGVVISGISTFNAVGVNVAGIATISGITTADTQGVRVAGVITATSFVGSGANLTDVISGVELKSDGNSVGTAITQINFSGFGSVTAPVSGFSTVTVDRFLTIGTRTGSAVTFSIADSSFIVEARGGGDVTINL